MTLVFHFCQMSSARGTIDGRGPVTRTRVPDRDEQGKPREDARRGRCHPLEAGIYPCGCRRYRDTRLPSTKIRARGCQWHPRPGTPSQRLFAAAAAAGLEYYHAIIENCTATLILGVRFTNEEISSTFKCLCGSLVCECGH